MAWPSEERRFAPKCGRVGGGGRKNPFFFLFLVPEIPKIVRAQGPGRVDRAPLPQVAFKSQIRSDRNGRNAPTKRTFFMANGFVRAFFDFGPNGFAT